MPGHPRPDPVPDAGCAVRVALALAAAGLAVLLAFCAPAQAGQAGLESDLLGEYRSLADRHARHVELAVYHLDEADRIWAEMARIGYRLRRLRDAEPPVLDLGAGP